jgi:hypothetical protein
MQLVEHRGQHLRSGWLARDAPRVVQHSSQRERDLGHTRPAVANNGFDEAKVRTVSENAHTFRFEQSGFEAD